MSDDYDGSYVENHCGECGEYESECLCAEMDAADAGREPFAPRTYRSGWIHDRLLTAEDWLREEAHAIRGIVDDLEEDDLDNAGTMDAIAAEIETLRRDVVLWSEQATRQAAEIERLRALSAPAPPQEEEEEG